jgi:hypothetical protein
MVTHAVEGRTVSRAIPCGPELDRTRAQIAEYQRFRKLAGALVATNEQICDARLARRLPPSLKETALAEGFAVEVERELELLLGTAGAEELDLEAVETALRHRALRLAGRLLKERLNADHSDQSGAAGPAPAVKRPAMWGGEPSASRACWEN